MGPCRRAWRPAGSGRTMAPALNPLHHLWRALPQRARRRWLARGAALAAPRPDWPAPPVRHGVAVAGELARASGLGEGARLMLHALQGAGVPAWAVEAGVLGADDGLAPPTEPPPPGVPLVLHVNAPALPLALLRVRRGLLRGRRVVGYWAWELPVAPPGWRVGVPFVHEVWAPSRFTAAALEALAPGRVRVVPHPVAAAPPRPSGLGRAAFGLPEGAVVTLVAFNLASSLERKNPLAAIAAHRLAFGARPDRQLLIRVGNPHHFPADFERLRAAAGAPNVSIDTRTLPTADSHALTAACDIVLSLHRSEGFGLGLAEAMLLGRAVVATDWSGNTDFMDAGCAAMVPARLVPARDPRGVFEAPGAVWAEPDLAHAAAQLRRLADDADARRALGARARAAAAARLGSEALLAAVRGLGAARPAA